MECSDDISLRTENYGKPAGKASAPSLAGPDGCCWTTPARGPARTENALRRWLVQIWGKSAGRELRREQKGSNHSRGKQAKRLIRTSVRAMVRVSAAGIDNCCAG